MKTTACLMLFCCAALLLTGCPRPAPAPVPPAVPKTVDDFFVIKTGGHDVRMQVAVLEAEMEHGLMERRDLGRDEGMIFVYARPQGMSFWMHDTPTPLDIGFFTPDGVLREIYQMQPFDETPVPTRSQEVQFALEMNLGWFAANGVRPGARLDLAALAGALQARGFEPKAFGLDKAADNR